MSRLVLLLAEDSDGNETFNFLGGLIGNLRIKFMLIAIECIIICPVQLLKLHKTILFLEHCNSYSDSNVDGNSINDKLQCPVESTSISSFRTGVISETSGSVSMNCLPTLTFEAISAI